MFIGVFSFNKQLTELPSTPSSLVESEYNRKKKMRMRVGTIFPIEDSLKISIILVCLF